MKKYWALILTVLFPYVIVLGVLLWMLVGMLFGENFESFIENIIGGNDNYVNGLLVIMALAVPATLITSAIALIKKWSGRELAKVNMIIKLVQIPFYTGVFLFGVAMVIANPILAIPAVGMLWGYDAAAICLSGIVGVTATVRCRKENKIDRLLAVFMAVGQFLFVIDIICAIVLFVTARKEEENNA